MSGKYSSERRAMISSFLNVDRMIIIFIKLGNIYNNILGVLQARLQGVLLEVTEAVDADWISGTTSSGTTPMSASVAFEQCIQSAYHLLPPAGAAPEAEMEAEAGGTDS